MSQDITSHPMRRNPVFWIMWLVPAAAVFASFALIAVAMDGADTRLPADYHWEGDRLDEDFERARRAHARGLTATLELRRSTGDCAVRLGAPADEEALMVLLTHSNDPALDRQWLLRRTPGGEYLVRCSAPPPGKYRIVLSDAGSRWAIRAQAEGDLRRVALRARDPGGSTP